MEDNTPNGTTQRGYGKQRRFVRAVEQVDGIHVVISHSSGNVPMAADEPSDVTAAARIAREHDSSVSLDKTGGDAAYHYGDGSLAIVAEFESTT